MAFTVTLVDRDAALDDVSLAHLATRVTCPVTMTIGLGDYVCPPSGEVILYANLRGPKTMTVKQNMGHGSEYGPDVETFTLSSDGGADVRTVSLDGAWRFRKTADRGAGGCTDVTVPHDESIAGAFSPDVAGWTGKLPRKGAGEYARRLRACPHNAPDARTRVFFAVARSARVFAMFRPLALRRTGSPRTCLREPSGGASRFRR